MRICYINKEDPNSLENLIRKQDFAQILTLFGVQQLFDLLKWYQAINFQNGLDKVIEVIDSYHNEIRNALPIRNSLRKIS